MTSCSGADRQRHGLDPVATPPHCEIRRRHVSADDAEFARQSAVRIRVSDRSDARRRRPGAASTRRRGARPLLTDFRSTSAITPHGNRYGRCSFELRAGDCLVRALSSSSAGDPIQPLSRVTRRRPPPRPVWIPRQYFRPHVFGGGSYLTRPPAAIRRRFLPRRPETTTDVDGSRPADTCCMTILSDRSFGNTVPFPWRLACDALRRDAALRLCGRCISLEGCGGAMRSSTAGGVTALVDSDGGRDQRRRRRPDRI